MTDPVAPIDLPLAELAYAPVQEQARLRALLTVVAALPVPGVLTDVGQLGFSMAYLLNNGFATLVSDSGLFGVVAVLSIALRLGAGVTAMLLIWGARRRLNSAQAARTCLWLLIAQILLGVGMTIMQYIELHRSPGIPMKSLVQMLVQAMLWWTSWAIPLFVAFRVLRKMDA